MYEQHQLPDRAAPDAPGSFDEFIERGGRFVAARLSRSSFGDALGVLLERIEGGWVIAAEHISSSEGWARHDLIEFHFKRIAAPGEQCWWVGSVPSDVIAALCPPAPAEDSESGAAQEVPADPPGGCQSHHVGRDDSLDAPTQGTAREHLGPADGARGVDRDTVGESPPGVHPDTPRAASRIRAVLALHSSHYTVGAAT